MELLNLNEQEQNRRNALQELMKLGINPYPAEEYEVNADTEEIKNNYKQELGNFDNVSIAGRIMSRRIMGAAAFIEIQDEKGKIQVYVKRDEICHGEDKTLYNTVFKKLLDIGDIIGIKGFAFITQTGQLSIHAKELKLLCKSLRVLPIVKEKDGKVYDAFSDPELRYRMRYVDLIVNPQVRDTFVKRSKIISTMRSFFNEHNYLEVETPILQPIPGGATARPFITHHNTLDIPLYLRIANELYLKRLIVGGFNGVYEFAKDFIAIRLHADPFERFPLIEGNQIDDKRYLFTLRKGIDAEHPRDIDDADASDLHHPVDRLWASSDQLAADIADIDSVIRDEAMPLLDEIERNF